MVRIAKDYRGEPLEAGDVEAAIKASKATAATGAGQLYMVARRAIKVLEGFNVRAETTQYRDHRTDLKLSMMTHGWYRHKPLACYVVKEGAADVIYCVEGHTRLNAYDDAAAEGKRLGAIPCVFEGKAKSIEDLTVQLATANKSQPYGPIELAVIVHRLDGYGYTTEQIAEQIGKTDRYVRDLLFLQRKTPVAVRDMIAKGQISATEAIKVTKSHRGDKEAAIEELRAIVAAAEAEGRTRITGKDIEGVRKPKVAREPKPETGEAPEPRARARANAATTEDFLLAAINYALALPDTKEWLSRWRDGDEAAMAELEASMGQPAGSTADASLRIPLDGLPVEPEEALPPPTEADAEKFEDVTSEASPKPKRDRKKKQVAVEAAAPEPALEEMGGL